jgi:hypothetical protein
LLETISRARAFEGDMRWQPYFFLLALWTPHLVQGQASPIIQDLQAVQVGATVELDWFIPQGLSCIDMNIQRLDPGETAFQRIGIVFGICGSDDSDSPYEHIDEALLPPNRTYAWRIYASNGTVVSDTVFLTLRNSNPNALDVGPNPLLGPGTAWYANPDNARVWLTWTDMQGRVVRKSSPAVTNSFMLDPAGLEAGSYWLQVMGEDGPRAQRRIVVP